eukprot:TRINITY_DN38529_c0_g1_i1.p1 TRINITY_DN38529_c0_g1~~TRINITY_DN38529_c0_g1_i1.p1  ORF type:complete len:353 (-),score=56.96 TRINITY_DN38529_c0_g1_i1:90-1148(-)
MGRLRRIPHVLREGVGGWACLVEAVGPAGSWKVVAFHPKYTRCGSSYRGGERVAISVGAGHTASGLVSNVRAEPDRDGCPQIEIYIDESSDASLVGSTRSVRLPREDDATESFWKDIALRAPRPALHLLRLGDLDKAIADAGGSSLSAELFKRNEQMARELGGGWAQTLLERCERPQNSEDSHDADAGSVVPCPRSRTPQTAEPYNETAGVWTGCVMWCDSDPEIGDSVGILQRCGLEVCTFREPEALLVEFKQRANEVVGVLTSMMEGDGRKVRGAMNAFGLMAACRQHAAECSSPPPVFGVISMSADRDACVAAGADLVVFGNRDRAQRVLLQKLRQRQDLRGDRVGPLS